jgi:hypothetical protein
MQSVPIRTGENAYPHLTQRPLMCRSARELVYRPLRSDPGSALSFSTTYGMTCFEMKAPSRKHSIQSLALPFSSKSAPRSTKNCEALTVHCLYVGLVGVAGELGRGGGHGMLIKALGEVVRRYEVHRNTLFVHHSRGSDGR